VVAMQAIQHCTTSLHAARFLISRRVTTGTKTICSELFKRGLHGTTKAPENAIRHIMKKSCPVFLSHPFPVSLAAHPEI